MGCPSDLYVPPEVVVSQGVLNKHQKSNTCRCHELINVNINSPT
jgi:hypothetical protein